MVEKPNLEGKTSLLFMLNLLTTYAVKYSFKLTDNGEDLLNSNGTFKHYEDKYFWLPVQHEEKPLYLGPLPRNGI